MVLVTALLSGCSLFGSKDNNMPPSPLTKFKPTLILKRVWSRDAGSGTDHRHLLLAPLVSDGRIYAADHKGRVYAYDADTGKRLWKTDTDTPLTGGVGGGDGLLLLGARDGRVLALQANDGKVKWRAQVSSEVLSAPRAARGVVVVSSNDGNVFGLDASDGHQVWVVDHTIPLLILRGASSPVLVSGVALCGLANGILEAIRIRDGAPLWQATVAVARGSSELERMVDVDGQLQAMGGMVYVAAYQGRVAAIDITSGQIAWERDVPSYAGLGVDTSRVFVTDDEGRMWALDRSSGATVWRQTKLRYRGVTAPVPFDGQYVVVGDIEGYLHWMDRADGRFVARIRVDSSGILSPPLVHGNTLYVLTRDGELAAYRIAGATP